MTYVACARGCGALVVPTRVPGAKSYRCGDAIACDRRLRALTRRPVASRGRPWEKQEAAVRAAVPGGKQPRGSGCARRPDKKSDVVGDVFRVEAKTTGQTVCRIERGWLEKIAAEALMTQRRPALAFGFNGPANNWMAFKLVDAERMMKIVSALNSGDAATAADLAEAFRTR